MAPLTGPPGPAFVSIRAVTVGVVLAGLLAACASDRVEDRRHGQQLVCHDGKTLAVSNADSFVHLGHGDSPGPCPRDDG
ncbi:MAG: hypothetical protein P8Y54_00295 [Xanthomonadales bacterium]